MFVRHDKRIIVCRLFKQLSLKQSAVTKITRSFTRMTMRVLVVFCVDCSNVRGLTFSKLSRSGNVFAKSLKYTFNPGKSSKTLLPLFWLSFSKIGLSAARS